MIAIFEWDISTDYDDFPVLMEHLAQTERGGGGGGGGGGPGTPLISISNNNNQLVITSMPARA